MRVKLDASGAAAAYSAAFQRMRSLPGFDHREVLRAEAGSILKAWAGRTKIATVEAVEKRARRLASLGEGVVSVNSGARREAGRVWFRTRRKKFQLVGRVNLQAGSVSFENRHFRNDDWSVIVASINAYREKYAKARESAVRAVGLARQSVIQIADDLGIDLAQVQGGGISESGIAKARAAIASNGQSYKNGFGLQGGDGAKAFVELVNRLPYGGKIGMDADLAWVVANRAKYVEKSYERGAFDSIRTAARAFPNIVKTESLAAAV